MNKFGMIRRTFITARSRFFSFSTETSKSVETKPLEETNPLIFHSLKTILTYALPIAIISSTYWASTKLLPPEPQEKFTLKDLLKGFQPPENRRQLLRVTRLNDKFDSFKYCMDVATKGSVQAEIAAKRIEYQTLFGHKIGYLQDFQIQSISALQERYHKEICNISKEKDRLLKELRLLSAATSSMSSVSVSASNHAFSNAPPLSFLQKRTKARLEERILQLTKRQIEADMRFFASVSSFLTDEQRVQLGMVLQERHSYVPLEDCLRDSVTFFPPPHDDQCKAVAHSNPVLAPPSASTPAASLNLVTHMDHALKTPTDPQRKPHYFQLSFHGDVMASQVRQLREEVSAIVDSACPGRGDGVVLRLHSSGGTVTGYGLAAAELMRLKKAGLTLLVCVDEVAASGGYLMASVADRIYASPFAAVGSIGVVSNIPIVHDRLEREGLEVLDITAGKYKRVVSPFKKPTDEGIQKCQEEVDDILKMFTSFIDARRGCLFRDKGYAVETLATGEVWYGAEALNRGLVDELKTADEVLRELMHGTLVIADSDVPKAVREAEVFACTYTGDSPRIFGFDWVPGEQCEHLSAAVPTWLSALLTRLIPSLLSSLRQDHQEPVNATVRIANDTLSDVASVRTASPSPSSKEIE